MEEIDWIKSIIEGFDVQVTATVFKNKIRKLEEKEISITNGLKCSCKDTFKKLKYMPSESQSADVVTRVINKNLDTLIGLIKSSSCLGWAMLTY